MWYDEGMTIDIHLALDIEEALKGSLLLLCGPAGPSYEDRLEIVEWLAAVRGRLLCHIEEQAEEVAPKRAGPATRFCCAMAKVERESREVARRVRSVLP